MGFSVLSSHRQVMPVSLNNNKQREGINFHSEDLMLAYNGLGNDVTALLTSILNGRAAERLGENYYLTVIGLQDNTITLYNQLNEKQLQVDISNLQRRAEKVRNIIDLWLKGEAS